MGFGISDIVNIINSITEWCDSRFLQEKGNAGFHNSIFRGKYLGDNVTDAQWASINAGTFDDMYIGDYWVINGITWRIAAFDYWLNVGNILCTAHHVVIVPDSVITTSKLNDTNITTGGYVGSDFYTGNNSNVGKSTITTTINNAFGSNHILEHQQMFTDAVSDGKPSGYSWYSSTINLMNEAMVCGFMSLDKADGGRYNIGIDNKQLPLFRLSPEYIVCNPNLINWYIRDIYSSGYFLAVTTYGFISPYTASNVFGIRPVFALKSDLSQ